MKVVCSELGSISNLYAHIVSEYVQKTRLGLQSTQMIELDLGFTGASLTTETERRRVYVV